MCILFLEEEVVKKKELTMKQRRQLLLEPCKTIEELDAWIKYHIGMDLPDTVVSRYAQTSPLQVVWEIYSICVLKDNPNEIQELLYTAARGSGKTLALAIAEFMIILHDQRSTAHIGAILAQAKHCYNYQIQFMLNDKIGPVLNDKTITGYPIAKKMNMEKSTFSLIDKYSGEKVNVDFSIIPCTLKAVNGLHLGLVSVDEIDTIGAGEGVRAFRDIAGMIDSRGEREALRVGISTRKSRYGLMAKQIDNAEQSGLTVRYWTTLEFSRRCPDAQSGTIPTLGYANQDDGISITEKRFKELPKTRKNEYIKNNFPGEKCLTCPISSSCLGDAKKQTSKSKMLKPISDSIQKALSNGHEWATSQLFNLKPSVEGIIYKEFEERRNVVNWNQMWKRLTGLEYPGECDHDRFVSKCHQLKVPIYVGVDFGWSNPSTAVFVAIDSKENVYILSTKAQTYTSNPVWAQTIKTKWAPIYRPQLCFIDTANPGDLVTFKTEGLPVPSTTGKPLVMDGVQIIKKWLRSLASPATKILMTKDTSDFIIQEFLMYHFKTDAAGEITGSPDSSQDHALDALRYIFHGLFGQSTFMMGTEDQATQDAHGNFIGMPTPEEYAVAKGLEIRHAAGIGTTGSLSELMEMDEENDINGDGGFLFGF